jgi:hypothetical protein
MSDYRTVFAIVEGKTEQDFIIYIVAPYLINKRIYITPVQVSKPGSKGGDVKFSRVRSDVERHLKQRQDTFVTTFLDLYGLHEWPERENIIAEQNHENMIAKLYDVTDKALKKELDDYEVDKRVIPYFAIYEFEALLFSDPAKLASGIGCSIEAVDRILKTCGGAPERINNSPQTAPAKRLNELSPRGKFKKTTDGIAIAREIGVEKMREKCPQFDFWLSRLEGLNAE